VYVNLYDFVIPHWILKCWVKKKLTNKEQVCLCYYIQIIGCISYLKNNWMFGISTQVFTLAEPEYGVILQFKVTKEYFLVQKWFHFMIVVLPPYLSWEALNLPRIRWTLKKTRVRVWGGQIPKKLVILKMFSLLTSSRLNSHLKKFFKFPRAHKKCFFIFWKILVGLY